MELQNKNIDEDKKKVAEDKKTSDLEKINSEEEKRTIQLEKDKLEEERKKLENEKKSLGDEKKKLQELIEIEKKKIVEQYQNHLEEEKKKFQDQIANHEKEKTVFLDQIGNLEKERMRFQEQAKKLAEEKETYLNKMKSSEVEDKKFDIVASPDSPKLSSAPKELPEVFQTTFPRLIRIKCDNKNPNIFTSSLVTMKKSSLNTKDVYILDMESKVLIWGKEPDLKEKRHATNIASAFKDNRKGICKTVFLYEGEYNGDNDERKEFWSIATSGECEGPKCPDDLNDSDTEEGREAVLLEVTDKNNEGNPQLEVVARGIKNITKAKVDYNEVPILDTGFEIIIIIGKGSNPAEIISAGKKAKEYISETYGDLKVNVLQAPEGNKNYVFDLFTDIIK